MHKGNTKRRYEKKNPTKKVGKKPRRMGNLPPTYLDRVSEARDALDAAHALYVDAVVSGNAENIRLARRALMIAIANYLAVAGGEMSEAEESLPPP